MKGEDDTGKLHVIGNPPIGASAFREQLAHLHQTRQEWGPLLIVDDPSPAPVLTEKEREALRRWSVELFLPPPLRGEWHTATLENKGDSADDAEPSDGDR